MGAMKQQAIAARQGKSKKNGAGSASGGIATRLNHSAGKKRTGTARWNEVDAGLLGWLIDRAIEEGCEITFGRTSDGGALKISLWDWHERANEYFNAGEDLNAEVNSYALNFVSETGDEPPLP